MTLAEDPRRVAEPVHGDPGVRVLQAGPEGELLPAVLHVAADRQPLRMECDDLR